MAEAKNVQAIEQAAKDEVAAKRASREAGADQGNAFPGGASEPPPGYIKPPIGDAFDNATHLLAGPEIEKIVEKVLKFPEMKDLRQFDYAVVWRKKTKPTRADVPVYVTCEIAPLLWRFLTEGGCPVYAIDLHWAWFDELRNESNFVHPETLERHVHAALMRLQATVEQQLETRQAPVQAFPETIMRYGLHEEPLVELVKQGRLWADRGEPTE